MKSSRLLMVLIIATMFVKAYGQSCPPLTAGCLDPTFGTGGIATTTVNLGTSAGWANDIAIQPDGKIVIAADSQNDPSGTGKDFYVLRYSPDGSLDPIFANAGVARIAFTTAFP
jgi:hypothetical protein